MEVPAIPIDDEARVQELQGLAVLDTEREQRFDDVCELARAIACTEIAVISLVDSRRQWFKSCVGAPLGQQETPRSISFCGYTILQSDPLIIRDTHLDARFAEHPLVQGEPHVRFYAGFPLTSSRGFVVGSLCAISRNPHQLCDEQIESLRRLASLTILLLEQAAPAPISNLGPALPGWEHRPSTNAARLRSLATLINRDQLIQKLDLLFDIETPAQFAIMRCWFRDYDRVNATLGGIVAEQYINEAARRVVASLPPSASVARFADAELLVLLPFVVDELELKKIAQRIIAFTNHIYRSRGQSLSMTVSVGIAISAGDYDSSEVILADSSMAVAMARRSSSSAFRFITAASRLQTSETYRFESEFREALSAKELEPHLQPIVNLLNGDLIGFEALARWPRQGGITSPSVFIPIASECGLTGALDLLIIEKSLAALCLLAQPIPHRPMCLSMNLSGILLEDDEMRLRLLNLVDEIQIPPAWTIQLELLEDMFQDKSEYFARFLDALVERNVRITIDDFGTGYSSLARLTSLPIHGVKLDMAFIARLNDPSESPRTLLRTMLTMLNDLGLEVTAEGVENEVQRDWLINHGAGKAQGYLFGHPVPISEAIALLHNLHYRPGAIPVERGRFRADPAPGRRFLGRLPFFSGKDKRFGHSRQG